MFQQQVINFVNSIAEWIDVEFDTDFFECNTEEDVIYIPEHPTETDNNFFKEFICEEFNETNFDVNVLGVLHEIGHLMTWTDDNMLHREIRMLQLRLGFQESDMDLRTYNFIYFKIPAELEATNWAVDYYRNHRQECDSLAMAWA